MIHRSKIYEEKPFLYLVYDIRHLKHFFSLLLLLYIIIQCLLFLHSVDYQKMYETENGKTFWKAVISGSSSGFIWAVYNLHRGQSNTV